MKALSLFLNRMASWKTLLLFLVLYIMFPAYILKNAEQRINELAGKAIGVIDLSIGFDPHKTLQMVEDYGGPARSFYAKIEMTADVAYPLVYAFMFGIILSMLYKNSSCSWVNVIPFLTMLLDFGENISIIMLLKNFPEQSLNVAAMTEVVKLFKWISFAAILLLIMGGLIMKLVNRKK